MADSVKQHRSSFLHRRREEERDRDVAAVLRVVVRKGEAGITRAELVDDLSARLGGARTVDGTVQRMLRAELLTSEVVSMKARYRLTPKGEEQARALVIPRAS